MSRILIMAALLLLTRESNSGPTPDNWNLTEDKLTAITEIGERIQRSMKPDIDPCVDYYEYTCGNFNRSEIEKKRAAANKMLEDNFVSIFSKSNKLQAEIKLENYLISCKERGKQSVNQFLKDFNILEVVGGWPALEPNWSGDKFDLSTAIGEMQSFTISVVVNLAFEAIDEKTRFLRVSPRRIRVSSGERQIKRIKDILAESGIDNVDSVADDYLTFEKAYIKAFSPPVTTVTETDFKGLKENVPELDWDKIVELITGLQLKENFTVQIDNVATMKKLIEIVKGIDTRVVMNYIFYNFVDRVHQKSIANCPEKAFTFFDPVMARHFVQSYYNDDYKEYFTGMMNSLVKTLNENSLQMFGGEKTEKIIKSIQTIVEEEYLLKLSDDEVEKEYEDVDIFPDKFYENSFLLRRHNMKHAYGFFFNERTDIAIAIGHTIPYVITQSLYKCHNSPTPIVLDCLCNDLVETTVGLLRHRQPYSEEFKDCIKRQVGSSNGIDNSDLFAVERTQIYAHSFDDWSKQHSHIIDKENEIWKNYGLTSKRVLFSKNVRLLCGLEDNNDETTRKVILSNFRNLQDFAEEYQCAIGSPMNPEEKCEIS